MKTLVNSLNHCNFGFHFVALINFLGLATDNDNITCSSFSNFIFDFIFYY